MQEPIWSVCHLGLSSGRILSPNSDERYSRYNVSLAIYPSMGQSHPSPLSVSLKLIFDGQMSKLPSKHLETFRQAPMDSLESWEGWPEGYHKGDTTNVDLFLIEDSGHVVCVPPYDVALG